MQNEPRNTKSFLACKGEFLPELFVKGFCNNFTECFQLSGVAEYFHYCVIYQKLSYVDYNLVQRANITVMAEYLHESLSLSISFIVDTQRQQNTLC